LETLERAATAMATQTRKRTAEKQVALRKVHVVTPTDREESNELEADLRRMGCIGLWEKSWRVRSEDMMRKLVTGEVECRTLEWCLRVQTRRGRHGH
jgi:hypothetical protein